MQKQKLTGKEIEVLRVIICGGDVGNSDDYLLEAQQDGSYEVFTNIDEVCDSSRMNHYEAGGVITSLLKKGLIELAEAEEYSLGCDCYYVTELMLEAYAEDLK